MCIDSGAARGSREDKQKHRRATHELVETARRLRSEKEAIAAEKAALSAEKTAWQANTQTTMTGCHADPWLVCDPTGRTRQEQQGPLPALSRFLEYQWGPTHILHDWQVPDFGVLSISQSDTYEVSLCHFCLKIEAIMQQHVSTAVECTYALHCGTLIS